MINVCRLVCLLRREREESGSTNLVALSNSRCVAGGVETLQSQQVQLGIWVVSDLMYNLGDDKLNNNDEKKNPSALQQKSGKENRSPPVSKYQHYSQKWESIGELQGVHQDKQDGLY